MTLKSVQYKPTLSSTVSTSIPRYQVHVFSSRYNFYRYMTFPKTLQNWSSADTSIKKDKESGLIISRLDTEEDKCLSVGSQYLGEDLGC